MMESGASAYFTSRMHSKGVLYVFGVTFARFNVSSQELDQNQKEAKVYVNGNTFTCHRKKVSGKSTGSVSHFTLCLNTSKDF